MKKYTETKNRKPFDWFEALSKDCSKMTIKESERLANKAGEWITCASGNQCAIIPRDKDGEPLDKQLKSLGTQFYTEGIKHMHFRLEDAELIKSSSGNKDFFINQANVYRKKAIKYLGQIEKRSAYLIQQEIKKAKSTLSEFGYKVTKNKV